MSQLADQQSRRDLGTNFSGLLEHFALIETGRFPLAVGCASLSALSRRGEAVEAKAYSVDMRQRVIDRVVVRHGEGPPNITKCAVTP
jgi:hypothetical protein